MKELNLKTIRLYIKEAEKNYKAALRRLKPHGIDQVYINNGCKGEREWGISDLSYQEGTNLIATLINCINRNILNILRI